MTRVSYKRPEITDEEIFWEGEMISDSSESLQVFFRFSVPESVEFIPTIRPFLFAFLLPAMRLGQPLVLPEKIDAITLRNLNEWQAAFADSFSDLKVIEIVPGSEAQELPGHGRSLALPWLGRDERALSHDVWHARKDGEADHQRL